MRKQVKLNCCTVSGLRLNGESRREIMRVSSCAYMEIAHVPMLPVPSLLIRRLRCKGFLQASRGRLLRDRAGR